LTHPKTRRSGGDKVMMYREGEVVLRDGIKVVSVKLSRPRPVMKWNPVEAKSKKIPFDCCILFICTVSFRIMKRLTEPQQRIVDFIADRQAQSGSSPTVREIAEHFGYKSPNSVRQHLRLIEQKGHLHRWPGKARGITVRDRPGRANLVDVPVVGTVAAGRPITAAENFEGSIALDRELFRERDLFTLRVKGDSMKGIGILDGDMAVIQRGASVENGEVAAVIVEDEATLKRVIKDGPRIRLRAENKAYSDIVVEQDRELHVAGKLVGVIRKC